MVEQFPFKEVVPRSNRGEGTNMQNRSDNKLITDYLKGDEKSLEILIKQYLKPIYNFTYRYVNNSQDAEDITQDVFVKVWRNLKKFDRNKSFKTWIFHIAKNTCFDYFKKKKAVSFSELEPVDPALLPDKIFEQITIKEILKTTIEKLLPKYRQVLLLRYNNDFTFQEISESTGKPLNTIKSQHRRALIKLKKLLSSS